MVGLRDPLRAEAEDRSVNSTIAAQVFLEPGVVAVVLF